MGRIKGRIKGRREHEGSRYNSPVSKGVCLQTFAKIVLQNYGKIDGKSANLYCKCARKKNSSGPGVYFFGILH